jgi:predicted MFS family arabinose efflux permease
MAKWPLEAIIKFLPYAVFIATFDRAVVAPMLIGMAGDFRVDLQTITISASAYYLAYGLAQPLWGIVSDRIGRMATLRLALVLAGVFDIVSVIPMDVELFIASRAAAGAFMAGVFPAAMIFIGDTIDNRARRQSAIAELQTGVAIGLTFGTVLGGIGIATIGWEAFFITTAVVCFGMAWFIRDFANPKPGPDRLKLGPSYRAVMTNGWAVLLFALVFIEAGILLGAFSLVPAALERNGSSPAVAGLMTGGYGVAVLFTSFIVRRKAQSVPPHHFLFSGGAAATVGFVLIAVHLSEVTVVISVLFQGASWVLMHTTLQTWITSVAPEARATAVSLFAGFMFLGNGGGIYLAGYLLTNSGSTWLFGLSGLCIALFTVIAVITQRRHYLGSSN